MDPVENGSKYSERQRSDAKRKLLDLVSKGVEASLVQLLETGILHADPHPGNLRYISSGQIGFLDFGLLCRMEKKHRFAMLASIVHIVNGDWAALVEALTEMDIIHPGTSLRRVTMDLEDALGELEFKDGIPDVKFSKVLGKIWSVALKFNFRMPSYYTLVLRSLASLEGLAMAGDPNYKTFNATYPYVVQKLLTENSPDMRKILHSVMLNRQKEFQWQKLALFLRVGTTRKGLQQLLASKSETSMNDDSTHRGTSSVYEITNLVLRLLLSKNGVVLRRLLMTVNGASLIRATVSKEAAIFRQQICRLMADAFFQIMSESLEKNFSITQNTPQMRSYKPIIDYESVRRDRRLKVIFMKIMESARKDPVLMTRFCFTSLLMFLSASALACHRVLVSLSEVYLGPLPFASKQFAV
jgi:aarF domain-containing kinase